MENGQAEAGISKDQATSPATIDSSAKNTVVAPPVVPIVTPIASNQVTSTDSENTNVNIDTSNKNEAISNTVPSLVVTPIISTISTKPTTSQSTLS